jgi:hypothetical protein
MASNWCWDTLLNPSFPDFGKVGEISLCQSVTTFTLVLVLVLALALGLAIGICDQDRDCWKWFSLKNHDLVYLWFSPNLQRKLHQEDFEVWNLQGFEFLADQDWRNIMMKMTRRFKAFKFAKCGIRRRFWNSVQIITRNVIWYCNWCFKLQVRRENSFISVHSNCKSFQA